MATTHKWKIWKSSQQQVAANSKMSATTWGLVAPYPLSGGQVRPLFCSVSNHPLSVTPSLVQGHRGVEPIPVYMGWGWGGGTPWTCRQFITGLTYRDKQPFTLTFTLAGNLQLPINLTWMSLDCERKLEYPEQTHASRKENIHNPHREALAWNQTQKLKW